MSRQEKQKNPFHEGDCENCHAETIKENLRHARAALKHIARTCIEEPEIASFASAASHIPPCAFAPKKDYDSLEKCNSFGNCSGKENIKTPTQMHKRTSPLYLLVEGGAAVCSSTSREEIFREARLSVEQYISDNMSDKLPIRLDNVEIECLEIEVHELTGHGSQISLPYQKWFDDYWTEVEEAERDEKEHEYKRFKDLREKYEGRFQKELAGTK